MKWVIVTLCLLSMTATAKDFTFKGIELGTPLSKIEMEGECGEMELMAMNVQVIHCRKSKVGDKPATISWLFVKEKDVFVLAGGTFIFYETSLTMTMALTKSLSLSLERKYGTPDVGVEKFYAGDLAVWAMGNGSISVGYVSTLDGFLILVSYAGDVINSGFKEIEEDL